MSIARESEILRQLEKKSPLSVEELSALLSVSEATTRRDLVSLASRGHIVRRRGTALLPGMEGEPLIGSRDTVNLELKREIAVRAASQITEGEVIAIDAGTTTLELAKELLKKKNITVFTHSMQIASILSRSQNNVYVVGGNLRKSEMAMVGSIAIQTVRQFNFDRFYMGLAGICPGLGPTDLALEEVEIKREIIARSKQVIALVDRTKFGKTSLVKVCDFNFIDEIVTNVLPEKALPEDWEFAGRLTQV